MATGQINVPLEITVITRISTPEQQPALALMNSLADTMPTLLRSFVVDASDAEIQTFASEFSNVGPYVAVPYELGMTTDPGAVVSYEGKQFLYSGKTPMVHSNSMYFPGATGVYYWAPIPETYEGNKVWPDMTGVVVAVKKDELWWNRDKTQLYRFTGEDNNSWTVEFAPGEPGVHDWVAVTD